MLRKLGLIICVAAPLVACSATTKPALATHATTATVTPAPVVGPINAIAAVVNNDIITEVELDKQIRFVSANLASSHAQLPPADILRQQVLDQMIN